MVTSKEDPVVFEVTTTLHEWHKIWISLYLDNQSDLFRKIADLLIELIDARLELVALLKPDPNQDATGREHQIVKLKSDITNKLDIGNQLLSLDLVPRDTNFKPIDPIELSPIKLYQLHSEAALRVASLTETDNISMTYGCHDSIISSTASSIAPHNCNNFPQPSYHLQVGLKEYNLASVPPDESVEIYFSIVDSLNNNLSLRQLTERFLVQIKNDDIIYGVPNTIFTNLGPLVNRDICLHIQVYRIGKMTLADGTKTTFSKQTSSHNIGPGIEGSTNSLLSTSKFTSNGLSRSRHSTIGFHSPAPRYRRPFGTTLIPLRDFTKNLNFKETSLNVRISATNESEFSLVHELYTKKNYSLKMNQSLPYIQTDISIKFISCAQESLPKLSTLKPYCLTEKRDFPDVVMPGDFKNDLHFTLESAEFEKGGKSISKNIEASISLIDKAGLVIDNSISPATNCDNVSSHRSCVFYHSNSPKWNESIKINVPLTEFDSAHIRIEFRHCSTKERYKKFLGFSFLPLSDEDGTVIADKTHELYLYKCDPQMWEDESLNLCKYTSLPYGPGARLQSNQRSSIQICNFSHSNREVVTVSTFLLSTKLTQNSNLLNLLRWRELIKKNNKDFEEALKGVLNLKGEEIVKFLQDILDTLFDTFTIYSTSEDDYSALIFKVLIHIFLLLDEPKYHHFKPVLDTYASAHFSATLVYKGLLACVKKCLEYSTVVEKQVPIQRCFKSISYVFQFIVQSKLLFSKATGEQNDEAFLNDLRHLFKLFENMLSNNNQKLIPIQVTFLESFPGALEQLLKVLSPLELAKVATSLAGSVRFRLPRLLSKAKLVFMRGTAGSNLIKNQDARLLITENFCRHLDCYIKHSEELELCHEVLEILIIKIHDYHWPSIFRLYQLTVKSKGTDSVTSNTQVATVGEINNMTKVAHIQANQLELAIMSVARELEPSVILLDPLLHLLDLLVKDFNTDQLLVQRYCTCLLTVFKLMSRSSFENFVRKIKLDYPKLCNLFRSFRAIYNRDWPLMQLTSHFIFEHSIDEISRDIRSRNDGVLVVKHLSSYVKLIVDFITHPTLQLEAFSERKKNYVSNVFGDLRIKFSAQLMRFWQDLTRANICDLIPTSIQPFLDASLIPNDELQQKMIPVFWDMIDAEDHFKLNSRQIERCLIDNLDLFINLDRGDSRFVYNFEHILKKMIIDKSPTWEQRGIKLINSMISLMNLLLEFRESINNAENSYKQMSCLVDLLNFYKEQDRMDLHLKYLFKLCDMHLQVGNHVEAAFTLKLYADEMKWCHRNLSPLDGYRPEEQEWLRKEVLYQKIISYFDKAKCWEENIPLCKELASFYENFLVDYEKVSRTLKKLAQFLDNILAEHRPEKEYFRVEFLGANLPTFVRGKEFIFRGGEYERLSTFIQRMTSEFPEAQVLSSKSKVSITKDSPGQYMVISNVKPVPSLQEHLKSGQRNINDKIIQYYLNNRLTTFSYDTPIMKGDTTKDKSGEMNVKNLWVSRHVLKVKKQLPEIIPWTEVVSKEYIEISPINLAIENINSMNLELTKLILSYKSDTNKQISPLTMRLQGVIEAAVNGGPAVFVNAFLRRQPDEPESQYEPALLLKLRELIKQQFCILETGLALHSKLAPPEVMPLHARLVERLQGTQRTMLEDTNMIAENNYEMINHLDNVPTNEQPILNKLRSLDIGALDEVDSRDINENNFPDIDDQIYSQPAEPQVSKRLACGGTRSEVSSPSRNHTNNGTSSSLSALTVLSNLPVNRSRLSVTPSSKDAPAVHQISTNKLSSNELCIRAARKLAFDNNRALDGASATDTFSRVQTHSSRQSPNQEAPPLPPRSFVINDKHGIPRATNRSQY